MATIVTLAPPSSKDEVIKVSSFDETFGQEEDLDFDQDDFSNARGKMRAKITARRKDRQAAKTERKTAKTNQKLTKIAGRQSVKQARKGGRQEARIGRRATRKDNRQGIRANQQESRQFRKDTRGSRRQGRKDNKLFSEQDRENYALEQELARQEMMPDEPIYDENVDQQGYDESYDETLDQGAPAFDYDFDYQEDNSYPEDDYQYEENFYNENVDYPEDENTSYDEEDGMYYFEGEASEFSSLNGESKGEVVAIPVDQPLLDIAKKIEWHHEKMRRLEKADSTNGNETKKADHIERISQLEGEFSNFCACGGSSSAEGADEAGVARRQQRVRLARLAARDIRTGRSKTHGGCLREKLTKVQSTLNPDFSQNEIRIPAETSSFEGSNVIGTKVKTKIPWVAIGIGAAAGIAVWFGYKMIIKNK